MDRSASTSSSRRSSSPDRRRRRSRSSSSESSSSSPIGYRSWLRPSGTKKNRKLDSSSDVDSCSSDLKLKKRPLRRDPISYTKSRNVIKKKAKVAINPKRKIITRPMRDTKKSKPRPSASSGRRDSSPRGEPSKRSASPKRFGRIPKKPKLEEGQQLTQEQYNAMMSIPDVGDAGKKGSWLSQQYAKKRGRKARGSDGESDNDSTSSPTEEEIRLQEKLPSKAAVEAKEFKEPLLQWETCDGKSGIPSWNKELLPEEELPPRDRPPTPVKIDHSISKWLENFDKEDGKEQDEGTVPFIPPEPEGKKSFCMMRVNKEALEKVLRGEQDRDGNSHQQNRGNDGGNHHRDNRARRPHDRGSVLSDTNSMGSSPGRYPPRQNGGYNRRQSSPRRNTHRPSNSYHRNDDRNRDRRQSDRHDRSRYSEDRNRPVHRPAEYGRDQDVRERQPARDPRRDSGHHRRQSVEHPRGRDGDRSFDGRIALPRPIPSAVQSPREGSSGSTRDLTYAEYRKLKSRESGGHSSTSGSSSSKYSFGEGFRK